MFCLPLGDGNGNGLLGDEPSRPRSQSGPVCRGYSAGTDELATAKTISSTKPSNMAIPAIHSEATTNRQLRSVFFCILVNSFCHTSRFSLLILSSRSLSNGSAESAYTMDLAETISLSTSM